MNNICSYIKIKDSEIKETEAPKIIASGVKSLAVVLPRYGAELGGGAETLVRSLILALKEQDDLAGFSRKIEVWSTCAKDHRTWDNYYQEGETLEDGVIVRRFSVDPRDLEVFITSEMAIQKAKPLSIENQLNWLGAGVNSKGLYQQITEFGEQFDSILFAPYLFATTFWGSLIYPERSVLIPCLHNEAYAYLDVMRQLFSRVRGLIFNAPSEMQLAAELYGKDKVLSKGAVVGMGFTEPESSVTCRCEEQRDEAISQCLPLKEQSYLLYSGRKEQGKNLDLLISYFVENKAEFPGLKLILIGSGEINFLKELPEDVIDLGFVSAEEKLSLMKNALALCQPSTNESFSIVLMEAWQMQTPVIVHGNCPVTRDHVVLSNGGLFFSNQKDFVAVLKYLVTNSDKARALGRQGREYVREVYSWKAVLDRLDSAFTKFGY